jgi:hypothetical protein
MCIDPIRPAIWIGLIAGAIAIACLSYVAYANLSSRNIGLGLGAFIGACVLFGMTLFFDLKRSSSAEDIAANVVIDYQNQTIRLYTSDPMHARSVFVAAEASKFLPKADNGPDRPTQSINLSRDFIVLALISYLLNEQTDWQMARATYRSSNGIIQTWTRTSAPSECTIITNEEVRKRLKDISNLFAKVEQISLGNFNLCLPPNSSIEIKPTQITIVTGVCKIEFAIQEGYLEHMSSLPGTNLAQPLYDGVPRYSTTAFGIRATTEYFALRAQDRLIEKYQDWAKRVVSRAKIWLEGPALAT